MLYVAAIGIHKDNNRGKAVAVLHILLATLQCLALSEPAGSDFCMPGSHREGICCSHESWWK